MRSRVDSRSAESSPTSRLAVFGPFLADGYTVIVPDTEGQRADFAAGPEYGMNTLDSIRAAFSHVVDRGAPRRCKGCDARILRRCNRHRVGRRTRPNVRARRQRAHDRRGDRRRTRRPGAQPALRRGHLVLGAASCAMALVGIARAFEVDFELATYLSPNGVKVFHEMQTASIVNVLGRYPGLKWQDLVSPRIPDSREPAALCHAAPTS